MQENEQGQAVTPSLYSQNLKASGKTYFFDVRQAKNGNKYLSISESWMKNGQKFRGNITVFPDQLSEFTTVVADMAEKTK